MRVRAKRFARDLTQAHARRRNMLRQMINLLRSAALAPTEQKGCTPSGRQGEARDAPISQSIKQSINQSINQSNQSINQSSNQSMNQSINQSINQPMNANINPYVITMADGLSGNDITHGSTNINALITEGALITDGATQHMEYGSLDAMLYCPSLRLQIWRYNLPICVLPAPSRPRICS